MLINYVLYFFSAKQISSRVEKSVTGIIRIAQMHLQGPTGEPVSHAFVTGGSSTSISGEGLPGGEGGNRKKVLSVTCSNVHKRTYKQKTSIHYAQLYNCRVVFQKDAGLVYMTI